MASVSKDGARIRDRISELSDSLISHILSFLDTKLAVRTSVLSTRWRKQWTYVPNLKFGPEDYPIGIDCVLLFRGSSNIPKFTLQLMESLAPKPNLDIALIESWICTVIWRNVVELDVNVDFAEVSMELPQSLFTCRTLRVLKLHSYFIVNPPTTGCFPSLKVLYVDLPSGHHDNSMFEKIFSNCPVLDELTIHVCLQRYRGCDINISAPELKMLQMSLKFDDVYWLEMDKYNFIINTPKLVNFDIEMCDSEYVLFQLNANHFYEAKIVLHPLMEPLYHYGSASPILDAISTVKHLSLFSYCVLKVLPDFDNMTHLKLDAPLPLKGWANPIEFLKRSPNLEYLSIKSLNYPQKVDEFNPPEVVPDCMLSHLKTIKLKHFGGTPEEMAVAKFLLKYSKVLKKMTVSTYLLASDEVKEIDKEFLMFERGSETCQVEILNKWGVINVKVSEC